jgi:phosphoribosylaminoimidazolecarboxamide formyltransferase/IMP cyclohydrolase
MLDGRVKTLHPKVHGGLLARRDLPEHMAALKEHGIDTIDLLVVNLYPFEATVAKPAARWKTPSRTSTSAARPWCAARPRTGGRGVLTDADQYAGVLAELKAGGIGHKTRFALSVAPSTASPVRRRHQRLPVCVERSRRREACRPSPRPEQRPLRQGAGPALRREPAPEAALYRDLHPAPGPGHGAQLQGKELSYNNIADADAAWECVKSFDAPACVIVKHANPCGVAVAPRAGSLPRPSRPTRPAPSAASSPSTAARRRRRRPVSKQFVEVLMAPGFTAEALEVQGQGQRAPAADRAAAGGTPGTRPQRLDVKRVGSGLLLQTADNHDCNGRPEGGHQAAAHPEQMEDLLFAWTVAKYVKSNAIVFCKDGMTWASAPAR